DHHREANVIELELRVQHDLGVVYEPPGMRAGIDDAETCCEQTHSDERNGTGPMTHHRQGLLFCWLIVRFRVVNLNLDVRAHVASWVGTNNRAQVQAPVSSGARSVESLPAL